MDDSSHSRRLRPPLAAAAGLLAFTALAACGGEDLTGPDAVATVEVTPGSATLNALGATQGFTAEARTSSGKMVRQISFAWETGDSRVATVDGQGTATARGNGSARIRATVVGTQISGSARLTVDQEVASLRVTPDSGQLNVPGDTLDFDASLTDPNGNPVEDERPAWTSRDTGVATVDSEGRAVARGDGTTRIAAAAGGAADSALLVVRDTTGPAQPNLTVAALDLKPRGVLVDSTVRAEATLENTGRASSGSFRWQLSSGGSQLASGEVDDLGPGESVQLPTRSGLGPFAEGDRRLTLRVDPGDQVSESSEDDNSLAARLESYPRGYDIELQFVGTVADTTKQTVRHVRDRWARVITGDLPDIAVTDSVDLDRCFQDDPGAGKRGEDIDDVLVLVREDSIDGEDGTLARAGPCFIRVGETDPNVPPLPVVGAMTLDSADTDEVRDRGILDDEILHEMGHVLGIGGLWTVQGGDDEGPFQLLEGEGTDDPTFLGAFAVEEFLENGGDDFDGDPVPVENTGGEGTRDGHWRESVFANEVMSGFLDLGDNPLSSISIASLADQFYAVDLGEADPYEVPVTAARGARGPGYDLGDHLMDVPLYGITRSGRIRRLPVKSPRQ